MMKAQLRRTLLPLIILIVLLPAQRAWSGEEGAEESKGKLEAANPPLLQPLSSPLRALHDRWRLIDAYGTRVPRYSIVNPYYQNPIKGDFPVLGLNTFMVVTALYTPKAVFTSQENVDTAFNNDLVTAIELFHGSTVFKPKDWSLKASGKGFLNRGNNDNEDFSFLELFGEVKLFDVGPNFDFTSVRGGVQFFKTDFNGFIFQDFNLGGQLFGELSQNRNRWSLAYLSLRKKENGLLTFDEQNQEVFFANWFVEDFLRPGFNGVFSAHYNRDRQVGPLFSNLDVVYVGFAADGHWGRWVLNPAAYFAFGSQEAFDGTNVDISAFFAGVEIEFPNNFLNYRGAFFISSGDNDPTDDKAKGFDSINDNVNLFGAGNSFVVGGSQFGTRNNSFIPSFRPLGTQANFINPGILLANLGLDVVFTPKLFFETNVNYFQFLQSEFLVAPFTLATLDSRSIGFEVNAAFNYRVFLNENFILQAGLSAFIPQNGGKDILALQGINEDLILTGNVTLVTLF